MQAIDTKHIKIDRFVKELWHFEDKLTKLEWENQTFLWMLMPWQFQIRLASAKPYGQEPLHH